MYSDPSGKPSQIPVTGNSAGPQADHSQSATASGYQPLSQGTPGLVQQNASVQFPMSHPIYGGRPPRAQAVHSAVAGSWEGGGQQSIIYGPSTSPNVNVHGGQARSAGVNFVAQQAEHPPIVAAYNNPSTIQPGPPPGMQAGPNMQGMYDLWQTSESWVEYHSPEAMRLVILMRRV